MITCRNSLRAGQHESDEVNNRNGNWFSSHGNWWNAVLGILLTLTRRMVSKIVDFKRVLRGVVCFWSGVATEGSRSQLYTFMISHKVESPVREEHRDGSKCSHIGRVPFPHRKEKVWLCVVAGQTSSFTEKQLYNIWLFNQLMLYLRAARIMVDGIQSLTMCKEYNHIRNCMTGHWSTGDCVTHTYVFYFVWHLIVFHYF